MRWKKSLAVIPVAMLFAVAACGGGSPGGNASEETTPTLGSGGGAGSGLDPNAVGPAPDVDGAQQGGTITILTNGAPSTMDPTQAYYTDSTAILSDLVIRSLTQYKYDPDTGEMILVPDLATDLGQANADNTEWTFTLKPDIKYEDGTPVTADDVAYAIKRNFATKELPYGPAGYAQEFFVDGDTYKGPFKDGDDYAGVTVDGDSVTIHMRKPFADMPYYASFPAFSPIPESKDSDPTSYQNHPMATGPYKFESYKPGAALTLVKNDQWDADSDPARHQYVDEWDFKFAQDSSTLDNSIINDSPPTAATYDNLLAPDYHTAIQNGQKDQIVTGTTPCTNMFRPDYRKVKELAVRQAIGWAYPYVDAWKAAGELVGLTIVPGTTILPPGTAGRDYNGYSLEGQDGQTTDPDKSKELLKSAGYDPGQYELRFLYAADDAVSKQVFEARKAGLEAGGFKVTGIPSTIDTIRDYLADDSIDANVRTGGWCSDWPNGASWFPAQWRGNQVGTPGMPNVANFSEPKADAKQQEILTTMSGNTANKAWGDFDTWMEQTYYPAVNTGYSGVLFMRGTQVGGMGNDNVRGIPTFTDMYVTSG